MQSTDAKSTMHNGSITGIKRVLSEPSISDAFGSPYFKFPAFIGFDNSRCSLRLKDLSEMATARSIYDTPSSRRTGENDRNAPGRSFADAKEYNSVSDYLRYSRAARLPLSSIQHSTSVNLPAAEKHPSAPACLCANCAEISKSKLVNECLKCAGASCDSYADKFHGRSVNFCARCANDNVSRIEDVYPRPNGVPFQSVHSAPESLCASCADISEGKQKDESDDRDSFMPSNAFVGLDSVPCSPTAERQCSAAAYPFANYGDAGDGRSRNTHLRYHRTPRGPSADRAHGQAKVCAKFSETGSVNDRLLCGTDASSNEKTQHIQPEVATYLNSALKTHFDRLYQTRASGFRQRKQLSETDSVRRSFREHKKTAASKKNTRKLLEMKNDKSNFNWSADAADESKPSKVSLFRRCVSEDDGKSASLLDIGTAEFHETRSKFKKRLKGFAEHSTRYHSHLKSKALLKEYLKTPEMLNHFLDLQNSQRRFTRSSRPVVTINVSGLIFETTEETLNAHPHTLLGDQMRREKYWNADRGEYFFNNCRRSFVEIFSYYQYADIKRPPDVSLRIFLREVKFFDLGADIIDLILDKEKISHILKPKLLPKSRWKCAVWKLLNYPKTSVWACCITVLRVSIIFALLIARFLAAMKRIRISFETILITEICLNSILTIEFLIRVLVCPSLKHFFKSFYSILDLINATLFVIFLVLRFTSKQSLTFNFFILVTRVFHMCRILDFSRFFKFNNIIRILTRTLKSSIVEISSIFLIITMCSVLFGTIAYYSESVSNATDIKSVGVGMWLSVITLTSVGYGDVYPTTGFGKFVAAVCACVGTVILAMIVPVVSNIYQQYYIGQKVADEFFNDSLTELKTYYYKERDKNLKIEV